MSYAAKFMPTFKKDLKTYSALKKQIQKKVDDVINDPYFNTEPLENRGKQNLKGVRSKRIDRNFRIIFALCEECRNFSQLDEEFENPCKYCDPEFSNETIIFFTVRPHKIVYETTKPLE